MKDASGAMRTAQQMREAFDQAFTLPPSLAAHQPHVDFLIIELAGVPHAIRLDEVAALQRAEPVTPLPSPVRELQGLSGHRGAVLPVYDLTALLGLGKGTCAWQLVARSAAVMLAVDAFHRHVRCPHDRLAPVSTRGGPGRGHIHAHLAADEGVWPVLSLGSLIAAIEQQTQQTPQERQDVDHR